MRLRRGELRPGPSLLRRLLRPPGRQTNQALLVVLLFAFGTGVATIAIGSPDGAWVAVGHGICGMAVVLLIPWKSRVARGGLRRARLSRWLSLLLAVLALVTLIAGLGYATGLVRSIAGKPGLWVHIAAAFTLAPLVLWHVWARGIRPRRADLSRRAALRAGVLAVGAAGLYAVGTGAISVLGLAGARRRFTGSYETASLRPEAMPSTSWLLDAVPAIDPGRWRLSLQDGGVSSTDIMAPNPSSDIAVPPPPGEPVTAADDTPAVALTPLTPRRPAPLIRRTASAGPPDGRPFAPRMAGCNPGGGGDPVWRRPLVAAEPACCGAPSTRRRLVLSPWLCGGRSAALPALLPVMCCALWPARARPSASTSWCPACSAVGSMVAIVPGWPKVAAMRSVSCPRACCQAASRMQPPAAVSDPVFRPVIPSWPSRVL